jgi:hypothetical protein
LSPRLRSTSAILVAFAVPLGVYLASLRGDVSFWDTADLQTVPYILGIPYPTGFPGYVLVGWVWSHAFVLGNIAWRLNVLGAVACAGTAAALAALLITLGAATAIAFAASLAYGLASIPWKHATYVDVHPLAFCAVAWAAVYAVRWARSTVWFDLVACVVAMVAALACDNTAALALPGITIMAFGRRPPLMRTLGLIAAGTAALAAVYAYLPLRSAAVTAARIDPTLALGVAPGRPFWDDGHPANWAGFVRVVSGSDFAPHEALAGMMSPRAVHHVVDDFLPLVTHDLGGFMPWLAVFGAVMLWWRLPLVLAGVLLTGLLPLLFASAYVVESEMTRYYLPAYFAIALTAGYAVAVFDAAMHGVQRYAVLATVGTAWLALIYADFAVSSPLFEQPAETGARAWIERVAAATPAHAIVVVPWNYATPLAYGTYVLHVLGDRIVLTAGAHEYETQYRAWMHDRPVVVVSGDPQRFKGFHVTELDDGAPHLYALR